jgi:hypothetical protein
VALHNIGLGTLFPVPFIARPYRENAKRDVLFLQAVLSATSEIFFMDCDA